MEVDGQHVDDPEVVVIGGGPAGLAAGLVLARSHRQVTVVDAGRPRNATAEGVHSFPTREGTPPAELLALGRADVERYGGRIVRDRVVGAELVDDGVVLSLEAAGEVRTRRVVLTTGLVDRLPDVAGLAGHWGRDVVHCPFCHGHEVSGRRIGVLATSGAATHQAMLFHHLADELVLLRHPGVELDEELVARLVAAGVVVRDGEVVEVLADDGLAGVRTADGSTVDLGALVVAPRFAIDVELVGQLGLEPVDHPSGFGQHVPSAMGGTTTVPQVRVAGNVTDPMAQVMASMAQGNLAGAHLHATLLQDDLPAVSSDAAASGGRGGRRTAGRRASAVLRSRRPTASDRRPTVDESTTTITTRDGQDLHTYVWSPEGPAKAVVQVQHGLAEHAARYRRFAGALTDAGYLVYAADARGSGRSAEDGTGYGGWGEDGWPGWVDDVARLNARIREDEPDLPLGLVAHSMGSFATQQYLLDHHDEVDAVVLSGSTEVGWLVAVLDSDEPADLSMFNEPFEHRTGFEWLSRDEAEVDAYVADPACGWDAPPLADIDTLAAAADPERIADVRNDLPILIVSGSHDPLAQGGPAVEALGERYRQAGLEDVEVTLYDGARHEILNETNRDEVTADILAFLDRTLVG